MNFLILLLGRIGDMILLTPFFKILNEHYPEAKIDVIASVHNWMILKDNPRISKIFVYNKNPWNLLDLILKIRLKKYSYYIDPKDHYSHESQYFAKIVRADKKIYYAPQTNCNNIFSLREFDKNSGVHFTQRLMQPLQYLGIDISAIPVRPELWEDKNSQIYIGNYFTQLSRNKVNILLNISASNPKKMWEISKWIEFLATLNFTYFNLILSSDPKDRDELITIHKKFPETSISPARNFTDLISLIKNVDIVITPDTSIVHLASAFNKPILALYSGLGWTYDLFRPLSEIKQIVFAPDNIDDIRFISVEDVKSSFSELLNILNFGQYYPNK